MIREDPGSALMPSTVVNISCDTIPPDYVAWSTFSTVFLNPCCLGFIAYVYSVKSRDRKMVGDMTGAQTYASTAKLLNIFTLILSFLFFIILIVLHYLKII